MLSENLFEGIASLLAKTAVGGINPQLSPLASLLSAPWPSHQVQAVIQELFFILRTRLLLVLGPMQIFIKGLFHAQLSAMSWRPAI
jgi:hypothetical protein